VKTFRLRERITIEEEELLVDRIFEMLSSLYETTAREKIFDTLDGLMNTRGSMKDDDAVTVVYSQSIGVETIKALLYKIRKEENLMAAKKNLSAAKKEK
jgi:hypothetical protein